MVIYMPDTKHATIRLARCIISTSPLDTCELCEYNECCITQHPELEEVLFTKKGMLRGSLRKRFTQETIEQYPAVFIIDGEHIDN